MHDLVDDLDEENFPPYMVEGSGCFGSISWGIRPGTYNLFPREDRDDLLDMAGVRLVTPYFEGLASRLLEQAGCGSISIESLDSSWCFEDPIEISCVHCKVVWQVGQGLWDALPDDQRDHLLEFSQLLIHEFFERKVIAPLAMSSINQLHG